MSERRLDPRTDPQFSLRNLLRIRSIRQRLDLAVVSTVDGVLMAGNQEGKAAQRIAAEASRLISADRLARRAGSRTGAEVSALRFESRGREMCLAVLRTEPGAGAEREAQALEEMAKRVRQILLENDQRALGTGRLRRLGA